MAESNSTMNNNSSQQDAQNKNQENPIQSLTRISNIPFIHQTLQFAFSSYERVKSSNAFIGGSLTRVEQISAGVLQNFKPVINRFEQPIRMADQVFCTYLDQLEKHAPILKTITPTAVYEQAVVKANEFKDNAFNRVVAVKDFGMSKMNFITHLPVFMALTRSLEAIVDLLDKTVDTYLPPSSEELSQRTASDQATGEQTFFGKFGNLTTKLRKRSVQLALDKFHNVQRLIL